MSNCSKHRKDVFGETNMAKLAEEVGNLHYETLYQFLSKLGDKLWKDHVTDEKGGRKRLASALADASFCANDAAYHIRDAWGISRPYMKDTE